MKLPFLSGPHDHPSPRGLRRILRGYHRLKSRGALSLIADINRELTIRPLGIAPEAVSRIVFGDGVDQAERICRQFLVSRVAGVGLNRGMLHVLGADASFAYHLPPSWRELLRAHGFKVSRRSTAWRWSAFLLTMLGHGIFKIASIAAQGIRAAAARQERPVGGRYAYFDGLTPRNLPQPGRDGRSHDILTWYAHWSGRAEGLNHLCHGAVGGQPRRVDGADVRGLAGPIPALRGFGNLMRFLAWGSLASLLASVDLLRGRWWHALLLSEAAQAAQVRLQPRDALAQDYMFHNSGWIYRPLWTYAAESKGSRILFYFYSTNCETVQMGERRPNLPYGWQAMNWPRYLVWDEHQADFVRRAVGDAAVIDVVGPIWFHTTNEADMPSFEGRAVAVFDITPVRPAYYCTLGLETEYYVPEVCIPFLNDIQQAAQDAGLVMLWKRKRREKAHSLTHPAYLAFAEHLARRPNVVTIDPDIAAHRVIERSDLVISMPYTSTALIARNSGKKSYFYDANGLISKNDQAAHGIDIVIGMRDLSLLFQ